LLHRVIMPFLKSIGAKGKGFKRKTIERFTALEFTKEFVKKYHCRFLRVIDFKRLSFELVKKIN
jgi:hypothetical protein